MDKKESPLQGHEIQDFLQNQLESGNFVKQAKRCERVPVFKCGKCNRYIARMSAKLIHKSNCIATHPKEPKVQNNLLSLHYPGITFKKIIVQESVTSKDSIVTSKIIHKAPTDHLASFIHRPGFPVVTKPIICYLCLRVFKDLGQLRQHIGVHRKGSQPNTVFLSTKPSLAPTTKNSCSICKKDFNTLEELSNHNLSLHISPEDQPLMPKGKPPPPIRKCEICHEVFDTFKNLQIHQKREHKKEKLMCSYCGKSFSENQHLKRHIFLQHEEHPYIKCDLCRYQHTDAHALKAHMKRVHGPKELKYTCDICGKAFFSFAVLKNHMDIHLPEEKYKCKLCPKRFKQQPSLVIHVQTFHLKKVFKCSECEETFSNQLKLYKHRIITHRDERYSCEVCGKVFRCKVDIYMHRKFSHRVKPEIVEQKQKTQKKKQRKKSDNKKK